MKDLIDKTLGPYQIKEKVGQGGMAHVFRAYQPALDRFVAIKVLAPALASEPGFTARFHREARAVARMNHPNILQVYDFGVEDDYHYIVMRYVEGSATLHTLMQRGESVEKLIDYILQVADALNYAHQQGIVHRDVKPSNILIDGKWALLSDFGLILDTAAGSERLTATGRGIGTAAYISPEQARGDNVDRRTDIYALGVILYEVLTGTIPHNAPTPLALVAKRVTEPVPPLRQFKPDIPESLEIATLRALVRDPEYRYSDAIEFSDSIKKAQTNPTGIHQEGILATQAISGPTDITAPTGAEKAQAAPEPGRRLSLIIGGSVVLALLLGLIFWNFSNPQNNPAAAIAVSPDQPVASVTLVEPTSSGAATTPPAPTATPASTDSPLVIARAELQVRSGPGDSYELLGYLPAGARADIAGRDESGQWWRVQTSLGAGGYGWIAADNNLAEARAAESVPIAVNPPPPTATPSATPPPPTPTLTPTVTATPEPSPTDSPTATAVAATVVAAAEPVATPTTAAPAGEFTLLQPVSLEDPTYGLTTFEWRWSGPLPEAHGFEVRVWRDDEAPAGVHNAVLDNKSGTIQALGNDQYRLVADITDTPGVRRQRGEYNWTVVLVQIEPDYKELGIQASPGRLRYEPPFGGSSGGDSGNNGGSGGGSLN